MLSLFLLLLDDPAEKSGFEEIYNSFKGNMFNAAFCILKNETDAEDAVSQAFMSIIDKPHLLRSGACTKVHAYLIIAAKNEAKNMRKKRKYIKYKGDIKRIPNKISLDDIIDAKATAAELEELLLKLPDKYFEVLCLSAYMDLKTNEIAVMLGIGYENAKKRLQRARKKLKQLAEESKKDL